MLRPYMPATDLSGGVRVLRRGVAFADDYAFVFTTRDGSVVLDEVGVSWCRVAVHFVRANVDVAIDPSTCRRMIVDDHGVVVLGEMAGAPAPPAEVGADSNSETEPDGAAEKEWRGGGSGVVEN